MQSAGKTYVLVKSDSGGLFMFTVTGQIAEFLRAEDRVVFPRPPDFCDPDRALARGAAALDKLPPGDRPHFAARTAAGRAADLIESTFNNGSDKILAALKLCAEDLPLEAWLTRVCSEYCEVRWSLGGSPNLFELAPKDSSIEIDILVGEALSPLKRPHAIAQMKAQFGKRCYAKFAVSPRQLELALVVWLRKEVARPFSLLGLSADTVKDLFSGLRKAIPENVLKAVMATGQSGTITQALRGACACVPARERIAWCRDCGWHSSALVRTGQGVITAVYSCVRANPLSVPQIDLETAVRIFETFRGRRATPEETGAAGWARAVWRQTNTADQKAPFITLEQGSTDAKEVKGPMSARLNHESNLRFFDRESGDLCLYSDGSYQAEGLVSAFIAGASASLPSVIKRGMSKAEAEARRLSPELAPEQAAAVAGVAAVTGLRRATLQIITGGPGTGKTTILKTAAKMLDAREVGYVFAAFTGKAVARIRAQTGTEHAATLDSLIMSGKARTVEHVIVDEASMVTTDLLARFLRSRAGGPANGWSRLKLTLVGDVAQLPPISWGEVFRVAVERFPEAARVVRLSRVYRLASGAGDLADALAAARAGATAEFCAGAGGAMTIQTGYSEDDCVSRLADMISVEARKLRDQGRGFGSDLCAFSPYVRSTEKLNTIVRGIVCPRAAGADFCVGDRVMVTKNTRGVAGRMAYGPEDAAEIAGESLETAVDVMNGESGEIVSIGTSGIAVYFDSGRAIRFARGAQFPVRRASTRGGGALPPVAPEGVLDLAYALTVHKCQGSEYKTVYVYIPRTAPGARAFITRELFYTAVSRARERVVIVVEGNAEESLAAVLASRAPTSRGNLALRAAAAAGKSGHAEFRAAADCLARDEDRID